MKQPFQQDEAFLNDVRRAAAPGRLNLWWLGQSGFLVQFGDSHLLLDPYLSDSLTHKYAGTEKPHVRMTGRVIEPDQLDFIDIVTSSHNHTDHLDHETILPLMAANPEMEIIVPQANLAFASDRLQVSPNRLTPIHVGGEISHGPFKFWAVPAAHEALERDADGFHRYIGLLVEAGGITIYHSGDTVWFEGMEDYLARPIDLALLPINGRDPARGVAGNLSAAEAVALAGRIGAACVVPCHFDMFAFNTVSPESFTTLAGRAGQPFQVLKNGEGLHLKAKM